MAARPTLPEAYRNEYIPLASDAGRGMIHSTTHPEQLEQPSLTALSLSTTHLSILITMQFKLATLTTLAVAIATFAPSALAASCYSQSGCPNCESKSSVFSARQQFCGSDDWSHSSSLSWGWAHVTLDGEFATQQECWDGFEQIIDQCYGSKDGGVYNFDFNGKSARLDVGFCNCE
ncbi:hypothetical protein C8Q70DRAFT_1055127 [Cubamyces menziesii]|nr:hypothetical protein C8Q70DRAFT_1055127 [Cubamyces menziesii]